MMTQSYRPRLAAYKATLFAGSALLSVMAVSPALAQTATWNGGTSTDWQTDANWSTGTEPTNNTVIITPGSGVNNPVVEGQGATSGTVWLGSVDGATLTVRNGGDLTSGSVTIGNRTNNGGAANVNSETGTAIVTGENSIWNNSALTVGYYGQGTLNITNGGTVTTTGTATVASLATNNGIISVSGEDSTFNAGLLSVGAAGQGTLMISNGGVVNSGTGGLGVNVGSTGTTTVTGSGSRWDSTGSINVGQSGYGELTVSAGGSVTSVRAFDIGGGAAGTGKVTVTGAGSNLTAQNTSTIDAIRVGSSGSGELHILDGGTVNAVRTIVGYTNGKTGTLVIDGDDSLFELSNYAMIGFNGTGTATVSNGATLRVNGPTGILLSYAATGNGTLIIGADEGEAAVGAGNIEAAQITFGPGTDKIIINHNTDGYVLAPAIVGNGTINVFAGDTTLTGSSGGFTGNLTVSGGDLTVANTLNTATTYVGGATTPTLTVRDGAVMTSVSAIIGNNTNNAGLSGIADQKGIATVTGENSEWNVTDFTLGLYGTGTLNVTNGGSVSATQSITLGTQAGSSGTLTVSGAGSSASAANTFQVGSNGTGTLSVTDGGTVSTFSGSVGVNAGSVGTATVSGSGSLWDVTGSSLNVGQSGTGTLTVSDGAEVKVYSRLNVGNAVGSTGTLTVTGEDSQLTLLNTVSGDFNTIGSRGAGTLNVLDGAQVTGTTLVLSYYAGASGDMNLDGAGSQVQMSNYAMVGFNGTSVATVSNGAKLKADGAAGVLIGYGPTGNGTLNIGAAAGSSATGAGLIEAAKVQFGSGTGKLILNHNTANYTLASAISGTGTLDVRAGNTILSGDSSLFTGSTSISGGKLILTNTLGGTMKTSGTGALQIGNNTASGSFANNVVNNGSLIFARSDSYSYAGQITGSGTIVQQGGGTTVLSADNSAFAGTTSVTGGTLELTGALGGTIGTQSGGTLRLSDGSTFNAAIVNNGTLALNRTGNYSFGGAISGSGAITKAQSGTLTLTGNNSGFTGTTTVTAGSVILSNALGGSATTQSGTTLQFNNGAVFNGNVANNGALIFNRTTDATFGGAISGSGAITKAQSGTLTLTGNNSSFTGTTTISGGTLVLNSALGGAIVNNGTLALNRTGDYSLAGTLSGTGTLRKKQSGTVAYEGDGSGFTGTTYVDAGTLVLTGALGGNAVTQTGTELHLADGFVFDGDVANDGELVLALDADTLYAGSISGNGVIRSEGDGAIVLTGDSRNFSGTTVVDAGILALAIGGKLGGDAVVNDAGIFNISEGGDFQGDIQNNGLTIFSPDSDLSYDGVMTGMGVLSKSASGTLTLTADSSQFEGTTLLTEGTVVVSGKLGGVLGLSNDTSLIVGNGAVDGQITGDVYNNGLLVYNNINDFTHDGNISGVGTIYVGSGSVTLGGDSQNFVGTTLINGGVLRLNGALGGDIVSNGTLVLNRAGDYSLAGTLSGSGTLRKQQSGTLSLASEAVALTGTTYIESGAIDLTGAMGGNVSVGTGTLLNISGEGAPGDIVNNGAVAFNRTGDYAYAGKVTGTGAITKSQDGTLTYSGNGSGFTGTTDVNAGEIILTGSLGGIVRVNSGGTLRIGNGATDGSLLADAVNNGILIFDQTGDYDYTGDLSGAGGLIKRGEGTLLLSGDYTYTGTTQVDGGLVRLTSQLDKETDLKIDGGTFDLSDRTQQVAGLSGTGGTLSLGSTGNLEVEQAQNSTFGGSISGSGTFTKSGPANLNLTGNSTFTGDVNVNGGTLSVNGTLPGNAGVNAGGTLGGTGTIGQVTIHSGGNLAPGNSIGTLKVSGDVLFEAGSVYTVEINAAGEADSLEATGQTTIQGGSVSVLAENGEYRPQTDYVIIDADGGVSGQFTDVSSNLAFLTPKLVYSARTVVLSMARNDISLVDVAQTPNQIATATAVDAAFSDSSAVYFALVGQSAEGARRSYDSLSGEAHPSSLSAAAQQSDGLRRAVLNRLDAPFEEGTQVWGEAMTQDGKLDATSNTARVTGHNTAGFRMGMDTQANGVRVGIAAGVSDSSLNIHDRNAYTDMKSTHVSVYAGYRVNNFALRGGAAYSDFDFDTRRTVKVGSLSQNLTGSYGGKASQLFAEAGYVMTMGGASFEPFLGVNALWLGHDAIREQGGDLALMSDSHTSEHAWSTLGVKTHFTLGEVSPVTFTLKAGWQHALGDEATESEMRFVQGGPAFIIQGAPLAKDAALLDGGVEWHMTPSTLMGVGYSGSFADQNEYQTLKLRITTRF